MTSRAVILLCCALLWPVPHHPDASVPEVPTPKVMRPLAEPPGTPGRNYPFFATDVVLADYGYVEEEFFYEGRFI